MIEGGLLMGFAVFVIVMANYHKRESKWGYFVMGIFFEAGAAEFIRAFAHWDYVQGLRLAYSGFMELGLGYFMIVVGAVAAVMIWVFDRW